MRVLETPSRSNAGTNHVARSAGTVVLGVAGTMAIVVAEINRLLSNQESMHLFVAA